MAGADHAGDDGLDSLAQGVFVVGGVFVLVAGQGIGARLVVAAGQEAAAIIHDGDPVGRQRGDGGGHKVLDGLDLAAVHAAAGLQHDRSRRGLVIARKNLALGDDKMDAGAFHALDGLDGAGQLAFQGAQMIDVLDKGGGAEGVGLVEDLIADAGGGQIVLGQRHAQLGHLVGGDQDGAAILDVILDGHGVQLAGDGGGIARVQAGEQDGLGRLGDGAGDIKEEGGQHGGNAGHDAEPCRTHLFEKLRH